jgi:lipopolysaccharide export system permease protein
LLDFLVVFGAALLLITFAFSIGTLYKLIDYMAKGLPLRIIGQFAFYTLPYSMSFTIPISALFSTLLLFGRLSSDSEISAMKSGGLSLWQIASPVLLFSVFLVLVCAYNSFVVYPQTTYMAQQAKKSAVSLGVEDPVKLLEEGRFIRDFPGYMLYVGKKSRNRVRDLIVYEIDRKSGKVSSTIRADGGVLTSDQGKNLLKIDLFNVRIEVPDPEHPEDPAKTYYASFEQYPIRIDLAELMNRDRAHRKRKNLMFRELVYKIRNPSADVGWVPDGDLEKEHSRDLIEFHQRICLVLSPLMFVLVAIPLGITSHRKESSVGMLMSLGIMFVYYVFIILSDTLEDAPQFHPWLIPWVPIIAGQIGGIIMIRRANSSGS